MKNDEFYIGWEDETPDGYRRFSIIFLISLAVITVLFTVIWFIKSEGFAGSSYDFGNQTTYKGIIHEYPAPMLVVYEKDDTLSIPLVNSGKFGVMQPMQYFKSQMRNNLLDYEVELRGTLIEFDGKKWMELADQERSLLSFKKLKEQSPPLEITSRGRMELSGEIVDPKCFFGVMKPGYGKVHLSCAVRCISGGIPPILVSQDENGSRSYFFLTGLGGRMINDDILSYVGVPVTVSGSVKTVLDWNVLEINKEEISLAYNYPGPSIFSSCNPDQNYPALASLK